MTTVLAGSYERFLFGFEVEGAEKVRAQAAGESARRKESLSLDMRRRRLCSHTHT